MRPLPSLPLQDKGAVPSNFTLKLRKSLHNKRVEGVEQLGSDRVIVLTFGSGEWANHIILELYDKGNILLTDPAHNILTLLRNSKHDADSRLTVGDPYPIGAARESAVLTPESIVEAMQSAEGSTTARQLVMRLLCLGKEAADHTLLVAGLSGTMKMTTVRPRHLAPTHACFSLQLLFC